jgi:hypothetical protein
MILVTRRQHILSFICVYFWTNLLSCINWSFWFSWHLNQVYKWDCILQVWALVLFPHVCNTYDNTLHTRINKIKTRGFAMKSLVCTSFAKAAFRCGLRLGWGIVLCVGNHDTWVCGKCSHIFSLSLSPFTLHMRKTRTEMVEKIKSRSKHKNRRENEDATKMVCNYRYLQCSQHNLYPLKLPPIMSYFCSLRKKYNCVISTK